jgi:formylglycine-generating enzyme required for sulfatase activity
MNYNIAQYRRMKKFITCFSFLTLSIVFWGCPEKITSVELPPSRPILDIPGDGVSAQSITPILYWQPSINAVSYSLQVWNSSTFSNIVFSQSGLKVTNQRISGLSKNSKYFWRVNSSNNWGTSNWSDTREFTTSSSGLTGDIEMISVTGGTFQMGDNFNSGYSDELPVHSVTLSSYKISKTEITQKQWVNVMGTNPSYNNYSNSNLPVENMTWFEAISFCNKLSFADNRVPCYSIDGNMCPESWTSGTIQLNKSANGFRLPTEAEWEFAARSGGQVICYSGTTYYSLYTYYAWYYNNSNNRTNLVATKLSNGLGIYDMSGNVWEWCWDWYGSYSSDYVNNPNGPTSGTERVIRGGAYFNSAIGAAFRQVYTPNSASTGIGLRVVQN